MCRRPIHEVPSCAGWRSARSLPISGCLLGPNYVRPPTPEPAAWHEPLGDALSSAPADRDELATWWTVLGDPLLSDLVSRTLAGNLDVQVARERVRAGARAPRGGRGEPVADAASEARAGPGTSPQGSSKVATGLEALLDPRPVRQAAPQRRGRARRSGRQRGGAARRARERRRRSRAELRRRARLPGAPGDRRSEPRRADGGREPRELADASGAHHAARRGARADGRRADARADPEPARRARGGEEPPRHADRRDAGRAVGRARRDAADSDRARRAGDRRPRRRAGAAARRAPRRAAARRRDGAHRSREGPGLSEHLASAARSAPA